MRPNYTLTMEQRNDTDVLDNWKQDMYVDPVSPWVRLAHYVVDSSVCMVLWKVVVYGWGLVLASHGRKLKDSFLMQKDLDALMQQMLLSTILTLLYYILFEGISKGRTMGKLVTGSIVIKEDGSAFTFKDAFIRSVCRAIPFEALSALGYRPWHDSLSKTAVVKKTW